MLVFVIILILVLIIKRAALLCMIAKFKYLKADFEGAGRLFNKAFKIGNPAPEYHIIYGFILLRDGHLEKARKIFNLAAMKNLKPQTKIKLKAMQALVFWKEGDINTAIEMLEALYAEYKNTTIYQDLGLLYILNGDKVKALKFNKEAYEYNPDDNMIMDNLAEAYMLVGDTESAKEIYEKLIVKEPRFAEAYWGYGVLLCELGEKQEGLLYIRKSLDKRITFLSTLQKEEIEELIKKYE